MSDYINQLGANGGGTSGAGAGGTSADQFRNQVLSQLVMALQNAIPQASASVVATATAGSATLPAAPVAFLTITVSGVAYKLALYNS